MYDGRLGKTAQGFAVLSIITVICIIFIVVFHIEWLMQSILALFCIMMLGIVFVVYIEMQYQTRLVGYIPIVEELVELYNNGEISYLEAVERSGLLLGEFNKIVFDCGLDVQINTGFMDKM